MYNIISRVYTRRKADFLASEKYSDIKIRHPNSWDYFFHLGVIMNAVHVAQILCPSAAHSWDYTQMYLDFPASRLCRRHSGCPKCLTSLCSISVCGQSLASRSSWASPQGYSAWGRGPTRKWRKSISFGLNQRSNWYTYTSSLYPASL